VLVQFEMSFRKKRSRFLDPSRISTPGANTEGPSSLRVSLCRHWLVKVFLSRSFFAFFSLSSFASRCRRALNHMALTGADFLIFSFFLSFFTGRTLGSKLQLLLLLPLLLLLLFSLVPWFPSPSLSLVLPHAASWLLLLPLPLLACCLLFAAAAAAAAAACCCLLLAAAAASSAASSSGIPRCTRSGPRGGTGAGTGRRWPPLAWDPFQAHRT